MSGELIAQKAFDPVEEQKKADAWGGFGKQLYRNEISFQLRSQALVQKLIEPATPEQIQAAEVALATIKKELSALIEDRKVLTARFKSVAERLMEPEKYAEEAIINTEAAILKAKIAEKNAAKVKEDKEKELKAVAEHVRIYIADMHAAYLKAHAALIKTSYDHALEIDLPVAGLEVYLAKVCTRVNLSNTVTPPPKPAFRHNTQDVIDAEVNKHFLPWTPEKYVEEFKVALNSKFSDWELALKNKPQAKVLNNEEYDHTVGAIDGLLGRETVAAKLDAISIPVAEASTGKQLKEAYKLDEPSTIEQAFVIINAFSVNRNLCVPQMRSIKPANIGVKQMIAALEAVKNNDNNFEVTGLDFKKIDKL